jgi:hypothetical protein
MEGKDPASFGAEKIKFSHWEFNYGDGWLKDAWLAEATIEAKNYREAYSKFLEKMFRIIPRISLISQSYIDYSLEPFLIHKVGSDVAFFRYTNDVKGGGLMFMEKEKEALDILLSYNEISEEFFYYWKDAVNASGYSAKLLLMFSAIEALTKKNGRKDWALIEEILGVDLAKNLFGTKGNSNTGLRHRLVHGEYFNRQDDGKNYLELVHNSVIKYFNSKIFKNSLIPENITNPQRHLFGNKEEGKTFVKKINPSVFNLKDMLKDFGENGWDKPKSHCHIFNKDLNSTY